jgi:hypothetical protein
VKIALVIACSLFLILGQATMVCGANASASVTKHDCGCGGKMSCCQHASVPQPVSATAPAGSQNQILSPVPAMVVWFLANTGTTQISPTAFPSLSIGAAPIFARNCVWLI